MKLDRQQKQSATSRAYESIKRNILENRLPSGSRITTRAMAKLAGVSIIPVIQAMHRLENEGLIEIFPNWGSRVILLDQNTIRDRYILREAVECQVARILARRLTHEQLENLKELASELDGLMAEDPQSDEFWMLDQRFHSTMTSYTESNSLIKALEHVNLFRLLHKAREQIALKNIPLPKDLHVSLVSAISSGDEGRAEEQMRKHIYTSLYKWLKID